MSKCQKDSVTKLKVNGIELKVRDQGWGEPSLLFLHYWGGSSRTWDLVIDRLKTDFRCIAYDQRGWGDSDKPETGYSIQDLANDAEALIQTLELTRYVLIGHSMGGKAAQLLASKRPAGLEALILVAPAPPTPINLTEAERNQRIQAYGSREAMEFVIQNVLTAVPLSDQIREQVIEDTLMGAAPAKHAWPEKGLLEDISGAVRDISVPTLVLAGENDQVEKIEVLERELIPNILTGRVTTIPKTGHLSPLEVPDKIASQIRTFLRG
jgi:pimeloyl-ACP methyl ester carboxylesterase